MCHPSVRRSPGVEVASAEHWSGALHAALVSAPANNRLHTAGTSAASIGGALNDGGNTPGVPFIQDQGQRYVLQTERGYAILPGQWGMPDTGGAWLGDCAGCHVVDQRTGQRALSGRDFSCETCHGPGGVHVDALVSLSASQQLRSASAPAVNLEMCRSCHAWAVEGGTE